MTKRSILTVSVFSVGLAFLLGACGATDEGPSNRGEQHPTQEAQEGIHQVKAVDPLAIWQDRLDGYLSSGELTLEETAFVTETRDQLENLLASDNDTIEAFGASAVAALGDERAWLLFGEGGDQAARQQLITQTGAGGKLAPCNTRWNCSNYCSCTYTSFGGSSCTSVSCGGGCSSTPHGCGWIWYQPCTFGESISYVPYCP